MPTLFQDADGDLARGEDEGFVGVGATWLVYLAPPVPEEASWFGFSEGWNAIFVDYDGESFEPVEREGIPLHTNLLQEEPLILGGTWQAGTPPLPTTRLALVPGSLETGSPTSLLYDEAMGSSFSLTLAGAPPADHWADTDGDGVTEAIEVLLAYQDEDGSGGLSPADLPLFGACHDDQVVVAAWAPPPTDLGEAIVMAVLGEVGGWVALTDLESKPRLLTADEAAALRIEESCVIE